MGKKDKTRDKKKGIQQRIIYYYLLALQLADTSYPMAVQKKGPKMEQINTITIGGNFFFPLNFNNLRVEKNY
jgi:hypothetical protein